MPKFEKIILVTPAGTQGLIEFYGRHYQIIQPSRMENNWKVQVGRLSNIYMWTYIEVRKVTLSYGFAKSHCLMYLQSPGMDI